MDMDNSKKVVVLRNDLLWNSETFILEQARFFKKWNVVLVGRNKIENGLDLSDIQYEIIPKLRDNMLQRWLTKFKDFFWIKNRKIENFIKSLKPDLIHIHFGMDAILYWKSIKDLDTPIFITLHGCDINTNKDWWHSGEGGKLMENYPERLISIASQSNVKFIAVSKAIQQKAIQFGIPAEKIIVHYIGVDIEKFKPLGLPIKDRENRILFVGRFVEKKAPILLIKAFGNVIKKISDAKLIMIGDGELLNEAKEFARKLDLPIEFKGLQSQEQIISELDIAKIFCLPSITASNGDAEGLPIANLEAIAKNIPIVVTKHSGNIDIFEIGNFGAIIDERNLEQLENALVNLLKENREYFYENFNHIFNIKKCSSKLEKIYNQGVGSE